MSILIDNIIILSKFIINKIYNYDDTKFIAYKYELIRASNKYEQLLCYAISFSFIPLVKKKGRV
jgi:hypothetical protein